MNQLITLLIAITFTLSARAEELTLGVYLPQAPFATNAERAAWAQAFADEVARQSQGALTLRPQILARKEDALTFARSVDLLIADGLFALDRPGEVLAHASLAPPTTLYALTAAPAGGLAQKVVACADCGEAEARFYANAVLSGDLNPLTFFASLRSVKDAAAALAAARAGEAAAAFAPRDHPSSAGLTPVLTGSAYPIAVVLAPRPLTHKAAVLAALTKATAGALGRFIQGPGEALTSAKSLRVPPRGLSASAILADSPDSRLNAPPIRLTTKGKLPPPNATGLPLALPTRIEPPLP